jgi:hypothetical protein
MLSAGINKPVSPASQAAAPDAILECIFIFRAMFLHISFPQPAGMLHLAVLKIARFA